jgi:hypothetical protein
MSRRLQALRKLFTQGFTINVIKNGKNFLMLNAFLPNKKCPTNEKFLSLISVSMDLEKVVINAFKSEFETNEKPIEISGCFFHFILFRNIDFYAFKFISTKSFVTGLIIINIIVSLNQTKLSTACV